MSFSELIKGHRLPTLFIGSGLSRRYINLPTWEGLLKILYEYIPDKELSFDLFKTKLRNTLNVTKLSDGEFNALLATKIEQIFNKSYFNSDLMKKHPEWLNKNVSPFKMCISSVLKNYTVLQEKEEEIEWLKKLRGKVHSIITTNYDTFIEDLFEFKKESVFIGQHELFNRTSVAVDELYKLHGCITKPQNILITDQDYNHYAENAKLFSAKLLTLISENPIIFIGYSIQDANVQKTLTDLVSCLTNDQIKQLNNHFYIVDYKKGERNLVEKNYMFDAKSYDGTNVTFPVTVISTDNYKEVYKKLNLLKPAMNIGVVKQVKRMVKDIVVKSMETNKSFEPIISVMIDDLDQLSSEEYDKLAIAIGNRKTINEFGYGIKPKVEVFEDILLDNKKLDSKLLLMGTYENHYLQIRTNIPIYKYYEDVRGQVLDKLSRVKTYVSEKRDLKDYLNNSLIRELQRIPEGHDLNSMPEHYKKTRRRQYLWIFKNIEKIKLDQLKDFLLMELEAYSSFSNNDKSYFHRLISMYDFLRYKK